MIDVDGLTLRLPEEPDTVAALVDTVAMQLRELHARGYRPRSLVVGPGLYAQLATLKQRELSRGVPLMLLGLCVVPI